MITCSRACRRMRGTFVAGARRLPGLCAGGGEGSIASGTMGWTILFEAPFWAEESTQWLGLVSGRKLVFSRTVPLRSSGRNIGPAAERRHPLRRALFPVAGGRVRLEPPIYRVALYVATRHVLPTSRRQWRDKALRLSAQELFLQPGRTRKGSTRSDRPATLSPAHAEELPLERVLPLDLESTARATRAGKPVPELKFQSRTIPCTGCTTGCFARRSSVTRGVRNGRSSRQTPLRGSGN